MLEIVFSISFFQVCFMDLLFLAMEHFMLKFDTNIFHKRRLNDVQLCTALHNHTIVS